MKLNIPLVEGYEVSKLLIKSLLKLICEKGHTEELKKILDTLDIKYEITEE